MQQLVVSLMEPALRTVMRFMSNHLPSRLAPQARAGLLPRGPPEPDDEEPTQDLTNQSWES
jgi:hypothetical protein